MKIAYLFLLITISLFSQPKVQLGVDVFFQEKGWTQLKGKRVGLITNHTGRDSQLRSTIELLKSHAKDFKFVALFAPEHGIKGLGYAAENIQDCQDNSGIPIFSLHGSTRRPTEAMLEGIDLLIYDIQDIGCRSYTYATTLYYAMEEAAKRHIPVIVFDRPNPINGLTVDGPLLNEKWRSFIGYVNVPYCHGMTIGELARFFNGEYQIGCDLKVVAMKGWKRSMTFKETGLHWIPTSPFVPEPDTPLFYATTGILGELNLVNLGGGYNLPFKVVGAPWIQADLLSDKLNGQALPGVKFVPFFYRPFYGAHKGIDCQGIMITITDPLCYRPLSVQYLILGMLKTLYPDKIVSHLKELDETRKGLFCRANGTDEILHILQNEKYIVWKLMDYQRDLRKKFLVNRAHYLLY